MRVIKIYIAGKVSKTTPQDENIPDKEWFSKIKEKFLNYRAILVNNLNDNLLENEVLSVITPNMLCQDDWDWDTCMNICIPELINCDVIAFLPDWKESKGARLEHCIALALKKEIIYFNEQLKQLL